MGAASKRLELMVVTSPPKHVIDTETVTVIPDARQSPPRGVVAASNKRGPLLPSLWPITAVELERGHGLTSPEPSSVVRANETTNSATTAERAAVTSAVFLGQGFWPGLGPNS